MSITIPVVLNGGDKCDENISATHWGSDNPAEEAIALLHLIYHQRILFSTTYFFFYIGRSFACAGVPAIWCNIYAANCVIIPSVYSSFILKNNSEFCGP